VTFDLLVQIAAAVGVVVIITGLIRVILIDIFKRL
jgi:hypothetical protein